MDDPAATGRAVADRAAALACAQRISPVNDSNSYATSRAEGIADDFRSWLTQAEDAADSHARRLALCLACQDASTDTSKGDVLGAARQLYRFLVRS